MVRMTQENNRPLLVRLFRRFFLLGLFDRVQDYEKARKLVLINSITLFAVMVLVLVGTISFFRGDTLIALLDFSVALLLAACIFYLRWSNDYRVPIYVGMGVITALFYFLFFTGGAGGTGFVWYYTYPFFSFYVMGKRNGLIASIILLLPSFIYLLVIWSQDGALYSQNFTLRFIPSILAATLFSYLSEATRHKAHMRLEDIIVALQNKEVELKKAHESLESKVRDRTRALETSNQNLKSEIEERKRSQEKQKQLEALLVNAKKMQAVGTLAGGVAHDLNNILSGLTTYPELLLLKLPADSPMRSQLETILRSGQKAVTIVQDLLTLSRRGKVPFETLDLNQVVLDYLESAECSKMLSFHNGISIVTDMPASPLTITGSVVHLSKTLMNLVTNAAEAMPGGGEIHVSAKRVTLEPGHLLTEQLKPGEYARLAISDTGIGIQPQVIDRIYEPFFSTKKVGRSGAGLGMAVVWGTVQDHDGHISVQSTVGKGTTFELWFGTVTGDISAVAEDAFKLPRGDNRLILVVDDVAEQREIAATILNEFDYQVETTVSGEAAVAWLKDHDADLVLLDMTMTPGISGLETYRRIRKFKPEQRVIITSGYADAEMTQAAMEQGVRSYLKKPYTIESLSNAIHKALSGS